MGTVSVDLSQNATTVPVETATEHPPTCERPLHPGRQVSPSAQAGNRSVFGGLTAELTFII